MAWRSPKTLTSLLVWGSAYSHSNCIAQHWQNIVLEPWVAFHPAHTTPGWMRKRKVVRQVLVKFTNTFSQRLFFVLDQVALVCIASNEQRQSRGWKHGHDAIMPHWCTFEARRQIATAPGAGIAKAHRHKCDLRRIVKNIGRQPRPLAQPLAACVIPGSAALMDPRAGR